MNRNKALIITGVILLVIALVVFLVGGYLAGWDYIGFFQSPLFIWICVIIGLYAIGVISLLVVDKINRL